MRSLSMMFVATVIAFIASPPAHAEIRDAMLDDMIMPLDRIKKAIERPYTRGESEKAARLSLISSIIPF